MRSRSDPSRGWRPCHPLPTQVMSGRNSGVLSSITALRKLVNHPKLIYDAMKSQMQGGAGRKDEGAAGFEDCEQVTHPGLHDVCC